ANPRLAFDRAAAYGTRLAIPAGSTIRFAPHTTHHVPLQPIAGARIAIGFAGLVDGPLDAEGAKHTALAKARATGYLTTYTQQPPQAEQEQGQEQGRDGQEGGGR
ncbi:urease subunit beta, partial [Streptacidiphilus cavernicola]